MDKTTIRPLGSRVIIEVIENEMKTLSGIIIPDLVKEKIKKGIIISVGPGSEEERMEVKPGDIVLYEEYAGSEILLNGDEKILILDQSEIFAIIN